MSMELCPNQEDDHAPFPHYLVTTRTETYVICAHCGHWIERMVKGCNCREQCHIIAALDRDLFVTKKSGTPPKT